MWNPRWLGLVVIAILMSSSVSASGAETVLDGRGGGLIAFYSERDGDAEICMMNADGSGFRQLTDNASMDDVPALSPDGSQIAFASDRTGNSELYVMNLADMTVSQLTDTPQNETHPDWSPDGTRLAFAQYSSSSWNDGDLYIMDADGGNVTQITTHPANDMRPAWFRDGTRLLFSSNRDGNHEIYEIGADGAGLQRITSTALDEMFPRPSPDGTAIVYTLGDFVRRTFEVHVMAIDGSADVALTSGVRVSGEDPVWTGDGERIIFQSNRTGNFEIFSMNADGSEQTNLTQMPSGEYWATWAPAPNVAVVPEGEQQP